MWSVSVISRDNDNDIHLVAKACEAVLQTLLSR